MALQVTDMTRKFEFMKDKKKIELPDPNANMSPDEVVKFYSSQYPELTTASLTGPKVEGNAAVYSIKEVVGTKG